MKLKRKREDTVLYVTPMDDYALISERRAIYLQIEETEEPKEKDGKYCAICTPNGHICPSTLGSK